MAGPAGASALPAWRADAAPQHGTLEVLAWSPGTFEEATPTSVEAVRAYLDRFPVTWLNVNHMDAALMPGLADVFGLHTLSLEDAMKPGRRPKVEDHADCVFVVAQMADLTGLVVVTEQLSLFIGRKFLVTVQERPGDVFDPIRERLRQGHVHLRAGGPDRLAHALLDAIVDSYFPLLEDLGEALERLEEEVIDAPGPDTLQRVQDIKRQLIALRRIAWPQRETFAILHHGDLSNVRKETRPFFRDVHDHTVAIMDIIETYRELTSDVTDLYLSSVNQRTSEIVKVLTMISTVFIPLTFITSVYGMNFDRSLPGNMPELGTPYAYVGVIGVMLALSLVLFAFFRRKGWI